MKPSLSLFVSMQLVFVLSLFHFTIDKISSSKLPLCHGDERSALLQFKESFIINNSASSSFFAYPKVSLWEPEGESGECCLWDGVECDEDTGHVISLDLTSSCLYGSIDTSSSLFRLVHLEWLSLADNDFNSSEIPSGFENLSRLSYLDLSFSIFSGQIPSEILELSKLASLNLAGNSLKLQNPGLRSLTEKLTNLEELVLSWVNISSIVPLTLANLSSLTSLILRNCGLRGEFPTGIFQLPNLQLLSVRFNPYLTGYLPKFPRGSPLKRLLLADTSFSGGLPDSIGNLNQLVFLDLSYNKLTGQIPRSISSLVNVEHLYLDHNNLSGEVEFDLFSKLKNLSALQLSFNNLSVITNPSFNVTFPKFKVLGLGSCNLNEFPYFLQNQDELEALQLPNNKIHGQIPKWMWNLSKKTLLVLSLSSNRFEGEIPEDIGNLKALLLLDLSNNSLTGHIPSSFENLKELEYLDLSQNKLSGEIPYQLSQLTFLKFLNVSHNCLTGPIPQGKQFDTFQNNSFDDNPGLCGYPLSEKCGVSPPPPPPPPSSTAEEDKSPNSPFEFDQNVVLMGYACGLVVGVFFGYTVITRKHEWFAMTFGIRQQK